MGVKCAWVGDSRVVLARYDGAGKVATSVAALSRDHKATDPTEAARIEAFYAALSRTGGEPGSEDSTHGGARGGSGHDQRQVLTSSMVGGHFGPKGSSDAGGASGGPSTPGRAASHDGGGLRAHKRRRVARAARKWWKNGPRDGRFWRGPCGGALF